ncbi:COG4705 family protein [Peterkaempfera griseoplana]|uniref:COG4705 family protein n=1 Tax=Peterkaempfera griseoplana TaxID=66896 RepID=UPI0006E1B5E2|nr:hypothetical protein [Peterkaempfera griseoplana]
MTTGQTTELRSPAPVRHPLSKVPEVTVYFWIVKVLTTGMGETASDFLAHRLGPLPAVALAGAALAASLALQLLARRYLAWVYWTAIVLVSVFGTMAADVLHVGLGVPYLVSTVFFAVALGAVFGIWYAAERTLSMHSIHTRRRELFYWAAVLTTFALGTATGDMTAVTLHLGYLSSGIAFAALISVPAVGFRGLRWNGIFAFWFAYVVTRPLGASFADWMGVSGSRGGLGLGTGPVSLVLLVLILALVGYLAATRKDVGPQARHAAGGGH